MWKARNGIGAAAARVRFWGGGIGRGNFLSSESYTWASVWIEGAYGVGRGLQLGVVFHGGCAVGDRSRGSGGDLLFAAVPRSSLCFAKPRRGGGRGSGCLCSGSRTSPVSAGAAGDAGVAGSDCVES